jgi:hypothetical protein
MDLGRRALPAVRAAEVVQVGHQDQVLLPGEQVAEIADCARVMGA